MNFHTSDCDDVRKTYFHLHVLKVVSTEFCHV